MSLLGSLFGSSSSSATNKTETTQISKPATATNNSIAANDSTIKITTLDDDAIEKSYVFATNAADKASDTIIKGLQVAADQGTAALNTNASVITQASQKIAEAYQAANQAAVPVNYDHLFMFGGGGLLLLALAAVRQGRAKV